MSCVSDDSMTSNKRSSTLDPKFSPSPPHTDTEEKEIKESEKQILLSLGRVSLGFSAVLPLQPVTEKWGVVHQRRLNLHPLLLDGEGALSK